MFIQLVITLVTVWIIAELLCRLILGPSVVGALRELFGLADTPTPEGARPVEAPGAPRQAIEPNATLRQLLADRQRQLVETGSRLELTAQAADVSEQLTLRQAELAVTEERLAQIEARKAGGARPRSDHAVVSDMKGPMT